MSRVKLLIATLLLTFFFPTMYAAAQDYDQSYEYNNNGDMYSAADMLTQRARHIWNELNNTSFDQYRSLRSTELYNSLRQFVSTAQNFENTVEGRTNMDAERMARRLVRQAQRIDRLMTSTRVTGDIPEDWAQVQDGIATVASNFNLDYSPDRELGRSEYENDSTPYRSYDSTGHGYMRWQGRVDGTDIIRVQANRVMINHLQARPITNASFDMNSPLPRAAINVNLGNVQGRGTVELVEQPSASNNYTAAVRISDPQAGADFYSFELTW